MAHEILTVRNIEQQAAFLELDGQISDGFWENVRPFDHYKPWCKAAVVVASPGTGHKDLGRNFWAARDNYNFTAKALLDVVGLRMLGLVRIARALGIEAARDFEFLVGCDGQLQDSKDANALVGPGGKYNPVDVLGALACTDYTLRDLRRDLNDLKVIIKNGNGR